MAGDCFKCKAAFASDADSMECDCCCNRMHFKCAAVSKKEYKQRSDSQCLRIYCVECLKRKEDSVDENIKKLLKFMYKLDSNQQESLNMNKINSNAIKEIEDKFKVFDKKTDNLNHMLENSGKNSYANVLKSSIKPVVIVKPKEKQSCKKTLEDITVNISKGELNVCNVRNTRDGGIILCCEDTIETMKAKQVILDKVGDGYDVKLPVIKNPRLKITNIDPNIENENIIEELKNYNENISEINMKPIVFLNRKSKTHHFKELIIEVNSNDYKKLIDIKYLKLPWYQCKILNHLFIKRCYRCCGFSHISSSCKYEQKCSRCAGSHKFSDCNSEINCCINCKVMNEKFNMKLATNHHAYSNDCSVYKRKLEMLTNKIQYNNTEE